jgi:glycosyltransferase involved in cell wall biosynthesis
MSNRATAKAKRSRAPEIPASLLEDPGSAVAHLESLRDDEVFEVHWNAAMAAHGGEFVVWRAKAIRLARTKSHADAAAFVEAHDFGDPDDVKGQLAKADMFCAVGDKERGLAIFDSLVGLHPSATDVRIAYAKRLLAEGRLIRAHRMLEPIENKLAGKPRALELSKKTKTLFMLLQAKEGRVISDDEDARILAMKHAILRFRNRKLREKSGPGLGRLDLITGGLGPGGAERQLSRVAIELERARQAEGKVGEIELPDAPVVVVRSHGPEKQNDFFLGDVRRAGVELVELNSVKPLAPKAVGVTDPELLVLLDFLPPPVNYGVKRLTRHFIDRGTDTASAWQDGGCLFAGLAALIAGVPSIHFVMRGLPPSIRRHLYRPEYEPLYRAMAQIPGVSFFSNSHAAAKAYCEWLDLTPDRFSVVYNGVNAMPPEGEPDCEQMWSDFVLATQDATRTIGGVFRFDTDKQPNVWIRFAARFLQRHPDTRFVLVGGGRLQDGAMKMARKLGIDRRILFTGNSSTVGFWLDKMALKVLLSRFEGLPNVLIEAQYSGVPVVTTPAGGAAECLIEGVTGRVVSSCDKPDLAEVVAAAEQMLGSERTELFAAGGAGRQYLDERFSIPGMLQSFAAAVIGEAAADEAQLRRMRKAA